MKIIVFHSLLTTMDNKWRPSSLSELTLIIFNTELTHLGSEASKSYDEYLLITFLISIHRELSLLIST